MSWSANGSGWQYFLFIRIGFGLILKTNFGFGSVIDTQKKPPNFNEALSKYEFSSQLSYQENMENITFQYIITNEIHSDLKSSSKVSFKNVNCDSHKKC